VERQPTDHRFGDDWRTHCVQQYFHFDVHGTRWIGESVCDGDRHSPCTVNHVRSIAYDDREWREFGIILVICECNSLLSDGCLERRQRSERCANNGRTYDHINLYTNVHWSRRIGESICNGNRHSSCADRHAHRRTDDHRERRKLDGVVVLNEHNKLYRDR
jgi:hypothetical protein